jgi:hypothetical protein
MKYLSTANYTVIGRTYFQEEVLPTLISTETKLVYKNTVVFDIANRKICFIFYSQILFEKMTLALANHPSSLTEEDPELTIYIWDGTVGSSPSSPWSKTHYYNQETNANYQVEDEDFMGVYLLGEETLNFYDVKKKTAYFWTLDAKSLPDWICAAPFRTIFHWFFSQNDIHLIHGAVVGIGDKSILLGARGGSGKSTTALSCILSGMDYLADDYAAVDINKKIAYNLYNSVKVTPDSLKNFPEFKEKIWNIESFGGKKDFGKAIIFLSKYFPTQVKEQSPLSAIFIPILKKETKVIPASKITTLLALAPTILFQLPLAKSDKMQDIKKIINSLPCYLLELGPDIDKVPEVIKGFLKNQTSV